MPTTIILIGNSIIQPIMISHMEFFQMTVCMSTLFLLSENISLDPGLQPNIIPKISVL